jgi:hypothetical protein
MRVPPRTVIILGCVSLLNDTASEMITPLMPVFLTAVLGAGPVIVGLIEGVAESKASIFCRSCRKNLRVDLRLVGTRSSASLVGIRVGQRCQRLDLISPLFSIVGGYRARRAERYR